MIPDVEPLRRLGGELRRGKLIMPRQKDILTTGEVAKICNVAPRTVSKWFDSGQLRGYRIPGSKDRRIPLNGLIKFMKMHSIPMDGLQSGQTRVLIVDDESEIVDVLQKVLTEQAHYEVRAAHSGFASGLECEKFRPHVMLMDMHLGDINGVEALKLIRDNGDLQLTKVIAMSGKLTDGQAQQLLQRGFDGYLKKPFHVRQVIEAIEDATAIVY
jgi:excisionase family DNA binding protein